MSEQNANEMTAALPAEMQTEKFLHPVMRGLVGLSMARQIGIIILGALVAAISVAMVLWSQEESYGLLFTGIAEQDASEIIEVLDKQGIEYKVDVGSGAILVPNEAIRKLKLDLAGLGLPRSNSLGYEMLDQEQSGFGTSKNVEQMRFRRALEGEIARTIMTIQSVKSARVLLALPKQSVFIRKQKKPSASVMVNLYQGRTLEKGQIESIVHLVASSVPLMEPGQVTVVDHQGRLLNSKTPDSGISLNSKQFEYKTNIEDHLMGRIENILAPLVGSEGLRTQISADVDFTVTERTQEMFNPDLPALRSEQTREEESSQSSIQGVPGALSNQPPPAGVAPEIAVGQDGQNEGSGPRSASKSATRNFELDKTITHTRLASGVLRRLSVAVVVDNRKIINPDDTITTLPYSQEDILRFTELVKQAVGYDSSRGDQVTVTNVAFKAPDELEALPEQPIWEQPWFADNMKLMAALAVVLFLVFGVLRPIGRGLIARSEAEEKAAALEKARLEAEAMGGRVAFDENGIPYAVPADEDAEGGQHQLPSDMEDLLLLEAPQSYEKRLEYVQKLVDEDPSLVAQVIKLWARQDG